MMKIEVMGTGCVKCKSLLKNVEKAVAESGIDAQIIKVDSIQEIMDRGVMMTPALYRWKIGLDRKNGNYRRA